MCSAATPSDDVSFSGQGDRNKDAEPTRFWNFITRQWARFTKYVRYMISKFVLTLSLHAARNPKRCIGLVSVLSIALVVTGLMTNFSLSLNDEDIFAPTDCRPREHYDYIANPAKGFPKPIRPVIIVVHAEGADLMEHAFEGMQRLFQAFDLVTGLDDYATICSKNGDSGCSITGPTRYWDHNNTLFELESKGSDLRVTETLSREEYWAAHSYFLGNYKLENGNGTLITYAESYLNVIELPNWEDGETESFETKVINALLELRDSWMLEQSFFRLEFYTARSVPDEFTRAIASDLPLVPFVFIIMAGFTCMIFSRRNKVQSRSLLGIGSVVTILCSIMSGFGLAFICGLPFTSMTQILPFVIFGVGLDDTFIITGAYFRTDPNKDTIERIRETMGEVGGSICITTATTTFAFCIGCASTIPVIRWLCLYAFPTIFIDFIYQITFFVAILVLDERRIKANRRDCCICITADPDTVEEEASSLSVVEEVRDDKQWALSDRVMEWYSDQLLRPRIKIAVLIAFGAFVAGCIYSSTLLEQEFKPEDFMPEGSYAVAFLDATDKYTTQKLRITAYFRDVDQSDPIIQGQMIDYINDLADMPQIQSQPDFCWVRDFQFLQDGSNPAFEQYSYVFNSNLTFSQQLDLILSVPEINDVYGADIARDENGDIEASRCYLTVNYVDLNVVKEQVDVLADQRRITAAQPINQGRKNFAFFNFDLIYFIWEFYTIVSSELLFTTVSGVFAVSLIAFILIPHWTAVMFVLPMMIILYVDLLGILQFSGLTINPLTYICLVMSIGLLVDFLIHLITRYYESTESTREGKVKDTLRTMGTSICVGGLSTLLGVVPLAFSSSGIIRTVFTLFFAMVSLGLANGLILLPVILSYVGPIVCVRTNQQNGIKSTNNQAITSNSDQSLESRTSGSSSSGGEERLLSRAASSSLVSQDPIRGVTAEQPSPSTQTSKPEGGEGRMSYQSGAWLHIDGIKNEVEV